MSTQGAVVEQSEPAGLTRVTDLFGGSRVLKQSITSQIDAHELLVTGLPEPALTHLMVRLGEIGKTRHFQRAIGLSQRTVQRYKDAPEKLLTREQSGRAWKFAEVFAKASALLGSEDEAKRWLEEPAVALDRRLPIELLASPVGTELVENLLTQLDYGVFV